MKRKSTIAILCFCMALWSCTPSDYCDSINYELRNTVAAMNELRLSIEAREMKTIRKSLQKATKQCRLSEKRIRKLGDFRGEKGLYDASLKLVQFYQEKLEKESTDLSIGNNHSLHELQQQRQEWQQQETELKKQVSQETKFFAKKYELHLIGN